MADTHVFALTIEASGEVTPAAEKPEAIEPTAEEELNTDG